MTTANPMTPAALTAYRALVEQGRELEKEYRKTPFAARAENITRTMAVKFPAALDAVSALLGEVERLRERLGMAKNYETRDGVTIDRHGRGFVVGRWNPRTRDGEYLHADGQWRPDECEDDPAVFPDVDAAFAALARARGTEKP